MGSQKKYLDTLSRSKRLHGGQRLFSRLIVFERVLKFSSGWDNGKKKKTKKRLFRRVSTLLMRTHKSYLSRTHARSHVRCCRWSSGSHHATVSGFSVILNSHGELRTLSLDTDCLTGFEITEKKKKKKEKKYSTTVGTKTRGALALRPRKTAETDVLTGRL